MRKDVKAEGNLEKNFIKDISQMTSHVMAIISKTLPDKFAHICDGWSYIRTQLICAFVLIPLYRTKRYS